MIENITKAKDGLRPAHQPGSIVSFVANFERGLHALSECVSESKRT
jgi:hypothetical protein